MSEWIVEDCVCDYGVFEDGELRLITNSRGTAEAIVALLEEDERRHRELNPTGEESAPSDVVNHPSHYESGRFECIDVMEETQSTEAVMAFCLCNAFKYLYRHRRKNGIEDIKKAKWYLDKYIEIAEREDGADNDT